MGRKYGSVEETCKFSPNSKYEFSCQKTAFVLFFVRKTTEFLIAKHWLCLLSVTQILTRTILKKINSEWLEKKIKMCFIVIIYTQEFISQSHFTIEDQVEWCTKTN